MKPFSPRLLLLTMVALLGSACEPSQDVLLDTAANVVIEKYNGASCEEIAQMQPKSAQSSPTQGGAETALQAKAIALLKEHPEMREAFINRVAGSIANRMFECNLIP